MLRFSNHFTTSVNIYISCMLQYYNTMMSPSKSKFGCWDSATSHGPSHETLHMTSTIQNPPFGTFPFPLKLPIYIERVLSPSAPIHFVLYWLDHQHRSFSLYLSHFVDLYGNLFEMCSFLLLVECNSIPLFGKLVFSFFYKKEKRRRNALGCDWSAEWPPAHPLWRL